MRVTAQDHPLGLRLMRNGRAVLAAVRPTADDDPTPRWWVSWSAPDGARARPVARPGQEESVLAHVLDLLDAASAPTRH
ncbi:hypothetical protein MRI28_25635 [Nocardiopsis dassonvillei]|uniref:hypothetical protein n=1 Tax=Nocardiopsis dassonvillei TaxID=2014 RepID=UPI00200FF4D4|nr:hypothetical protein [Nocardiopsis dassonvillei]MCK9872971.1 hypothetical protein [Nocardiopsis dassonvillei]